MLTVQTSQPKRMYTEQDIVYTAKWWFARILWSSITTACYWVDKTNKYLYVLRSRSSTPWLFCLRYTYDTNWKLWNKTEITLSWFWTFSSAPELYIFQGSHSWDFYIACSGAWGSANFTVKDICPVTVSGTTMTKWSNLSVPTVASYSVNRCFAVGAVVYVFYNLTASPYTMNVWRKYAGSWSTLAGNALPSSVQAYTSNWWDDFKNSMWWSNNYWANVLWVGTGYDKFYNYFSTSEDNAIFDAATDTWSNSPYYFTRMAADVWWWIILCSSIGGTRILSSSLAEKWWMPKWNLGPWSMYSPIMDIDSWILLWQHTTTFLAFYWYFSGAAKRVWKVYSTDVSGWSVLLTSIDSWNWWAFEITSTSQMPELDYFWETSLKVYAVAVSTNNIYAEITD